MTHPTLVMVGVRTSLTVCMKDKTRLQMRIKDDPSYLGDGWGEDEPHCVYEAEDEAADEYGDF